MIVARNFFVDDERYGFETYNVPSADWNPPLCVRSTMCGVCVLQTRNSTQRAQLDETAGKPHLAGYVQFSFHRCDPSKLQAAPKAQDGGISVRNNG